MTQEGERRRRLPRFEGPSGLAPSLLPVRFISRTHVQDGDEDPPPERRSVEEWADPVSNQPPKRTRGSVRAEFPAGDLRLEESSGQMDTALGGHGGGQQEQSRQKAGKAARSQKEGGGDTEDMEEAAPGDSASFQPQVNSQRSGGGSGWTPSDRRPVSSFLGGQGDTAEREVEAQLRGDGRQSPGPGTRDGRRRRCCSLWLCLHDNQTRGPAGKHALPSLRLPTFSPVQTPAGRRLPGLRGPRRPDHLLPWL